MFGSCTLCTIRTFKFGIIVSSFLIIELRRSTVHSDSYILTRLVSGSLNCSHNRTQCILCSVKSRSKTSFITNSSTQTTVVQNFLQCVEYFGSHTQTFTETLCAYRADHKFLKCNRSIGVRATIDNVHHRNRQHISIRSADITVKRLVQIIGGSFSYGKRNTQHGIGSQLRLRLCSVQSDQFMVDLTLVQSTHTDNCWCNNLVHIIYGFQNTFAAITFFIAITKFDCFVFTG